MIIGISFVLAPTSVCAATTPRTPARAASRCTWLPSAFLAPRTVLPSTRTGIRAASPPPRPLLARSPAALTRSISQVPVAASKAAASAPVTTRQIVAFDGGPAPGRTAPHRRYKSSITSAGTSAAHPAIAVNDRDPATTAAAASASTAATG